MATILMISVSGSPGVTTAALATTLRWRRSSLLLEADSSKYSSILTGFMRGQIPHSRGLTELAVVSNNSGALDVNQLLAQTINLVGEEDGLDRWLVPGFKDPAAARGMDPAWGHLMSAASSLEARAMDTIIDAGRWSARESRTALLRMADAVVIVAEPTIPDFVAVRTRLPEIRDELAAYGRQDSIALMLVEQAAGPRRSDNDAKKSLGVSRVARIAYDPRAAAVFSYGERASKPFEKTAFGRSIDSAIGMFQALLEEQRRRLDENHTFDLEMQR